jgi:hypothetical protein
MKYLWKEGKKERGMERKGRRNRGRKGKIRKRADMVSALKKPSLEATTI